MSRKWVKKLLYEKKYKFFEKPLEKPDFIMYTEKAVT